MLLATTCVSGTIWCLAKPDLVLDLLELSLSLQRQKQKKEGVKVKSNFKIGLHILGKVQKRQNEALLVWLSG